MPSLGFAGALIPPLLFLCLGDLVVVLLGSPAMEKGRAYALALRLLLGMVGATLLILAEDLLGIPIRWTSLALPAAGALVAARGIALRRKESTGGADAQELAPPRPSLPDLFPALAVLAILLVSAVQSYLIPPWTYDSLVGWDLVGKIMAQEGAFRSSVFEKIAFNAQAVYPPLTASMYGIYYLFHPESPQWWIFVMAVAFAVLAYGEKASLLRSSFLALLGLFFILSGHEVLFYLTAAHTDVPNMVFFSLGCFWALSYPQRRRSLAMCLVFFTAAMLTRSETLLVIGGVVLWMLARERFRDLRPLWILLPAALFFVFWNLFYVRGLIGYHPEAHFRSSLDWDPARAWEVIARAMTILSWRETYGDLVPLFLGSLVLWGLLRWGPPVASPVRPEAILGLLVLTFAAYLPFFYMWDPKLNPLWTMEHTFKRGVFRYIPLAVLFSMLTIRMAWDAWAARRSSPARPPRRSRGSTA
jgi:hypothetical protein